MRANGAQLREISSLIDARLAKSEEDLKKGRTFGPFTSAKEMAASIEANIKKMRAAKRTAKPAR